MTTTTAGSSVRRSSRRGVTLTEMMISAGISSFVLAAVFSAFIFLSRSCLATTDYAGMDQEARTGLEVFSREVRMADWVSNFSSTGLRLRIPNATSFYEIDYTYVPQHKAFYRGYGTSSQTLLIKGVESFNLRRYTLQQTAASNDLETKQIQLELRAVRTGPAKAFASNNVISARYILRNKVVSN